MNAHRDKINARPKPGRVLVLAFTWAAPLFVLACGSGPRFQAITFNAEPDQYRSSSTTRESIVEVTRVGAGLHCVVVSSSHPEKNHTGGIRIPCRGAKACLLEMAFPDCAGIVRMSVEAYNVRGERVAHWETEQWPKLPRGQTRYEFVPNRGTKSFASVAAAASGSFEALHVYVTIQRTAGATFDILKAAMAK